MEEYQEKLRRLVKKTMNTSMTNRWIVLFIDLLLCTVGFFSSLYAQKQGVEISVSFFDAWVLGALFFVFCTLSFWYFKSFRGLIRHSNFREMWRLFVSLLAACLMLYGVIYLLDVRIGHRYFFVQNVFLIGFVLMLIVRFLIVRLYHYSVSYTGKIIKKTLVYGIGTHSITLAQWINSTSANQYQVQGFVTRNINARRTRIQDIPVYCLDVSRLDGFMHKHEISAILFPDYSSVKKEQVFISKCIDMDISVLVSPPFQGFDGNRKFRYQMKPIQFEDLLGRDEIQIDMERVAGQIKDKVILITGAAGSIGSELVRQIGQFKPRMLLLFDVAETPLHHLRLEMERNFSDLCFIPIIGDIRNENLLEHIFVKYQPKLVYHAAAYKHVPMMEENPCEAILVNVQGTRLLSDLAVKYDVEGFVMISTDKAVNPTNVMGASKRVAEIYVQSLANEVMSKACQTRFVTTRFGNVLGSNGSVIPHFKTQIEKGGPVTVTHPEIIRYFMTIPEACRLVLEAASFGNSGEIYVFDMGSPVRIADLARRMIELAGFIPEVDIKIEYIGLRPGEKLYEELLNDKEYTVPTKNDKITVAEVRKYPFDQVMESIQQLVASSQAVEIKEAIRKMKKIIPEFKSQNSPYSELDE